MEKLIEMLEELNPEIDYTTEEHLIDNHLLDSLAILSLIGDIEDEFDDEEVKVEKINDNEYIVDGDMELDELLDEYNIDILSNIVDNEYFSDTIGGLVMEILGGIPKEKVIIEVKKLSKLMPKNVK